MKIKENLDVENIFGDISQKLIWTDNPMLNVGDEITITNSNCEFEFDVSKNEFSRNLMYAYIVDLDIIDIDIKDYVPEKSNNGGCYAFATCKIKKILEKGY